MNRPPSPDAQSVSSISTMHFDFLNGLFDVCAKLVLKHFLGRLPVFDHGKAFFPAGGERGVKKLFRSAAHISDDLLSLLRRRDNLCFTVYMDIPDILQFLYNSRPGSRGAYPAGFDLLPEFLVFNELPAFPW